MFPHQVTKQGLLSSFIPDNLKKKVKAGIGAANATRKKRVYTKEDKEIDDVDSDEVNHAFNHHLNHHLTIISSDDDTFTTAEMRAR